MRKSYLRMLLAYMKKVYKIEDALGRLSDDRVNPTYRTSEAILPVLLRFMVRIQSLNELKYKIRSKDFQGVISRKTKLPQIDVIRKVLKRIDLSGLEDLTSSIVKKTRENVVHVKENNISSIKKIKSKINKSKCKEEWRDSKRSCVVKAYEEGFKMDGVTETLRFVKFSKKTPEGKYSQVLVVTTDFNIPLQTLYKIMHKRWDIENSTFNKLKTYAGLDHCFVHHANAIETILHLMVTANNIMQLFVHRRLTGKTVKETRKKELIRLIEKDIYTYKENIVIDTC